MPTYSPLLQKAHLADIEPDVHGLISKRTAELDGVSVTEVTFGVGARWSQDPKDYAGTASCLLPHVALMLGGTLRVVLDDALMLGGTLRVVLDDALMLGGTLRVVLDDGAQEDYSAGDVMLLPPGHDAWTVGEEPAVFVEFSRGNDYYS